MSLASEEPASHQIPEEQRFADTSQVCGLNCAYIFLHLHDCVPDYELLRKGMCARPGGNNLTELRDTLRRAGLSVSIYKGDAIALEHCPTPFIGLMKPQPGSTVGHFVIVLEVLPEKIRVLDGTLPVRRLFSRQEFLNEWQGYLLARTRPSVAVDGLLIAGAILSCLLLTYAFCTFKPTSVVLRCASEADAPSCGSVSYSTVRRSLLILVVTSVLTLPHAHLFGQDDTGTAANTSSAAVPDSWRVPRYAGVNCAYLLLRLRNRSVTYQDLFDAIRPNERSTSMTGIREACKGFGENLAIYNCRPDQLSGLPMPIIVSLDNPQSSESAFALVLQCSHDPVDLIFAGNVSVAQLPVESFRRRWTGYVLVSENQCFSSVIRYFGVAACATLAYFVLRLSITRLHIPNGKRKLLLRKDQ